MPRPRLIHHRAKSSRRLPPQPHLIACLKICPHWQLAALLALTRPREERKQALIHRKSNQPWTPAHSQTLTQACDELRRTLTLDFPLHLQPEGDYHFAIPLPPSQFNHAKAIAVALSPCSLPHLWLTLDKLFIRNGRFYRRRRGFMLELTPATNIHLPRKLRSALRGAKPWNHTPKPNRSKPPTAAK